VSHKHDKLIVIQQCAVSYTGTYFTTFLFIVSINKIRKQDKMIKNMTLMYIEYLMNANDVIVQEKIEIIMIVNNEKLK